MYRPNAAADNYQITTGKVGCLLLHVHECYAGKYRPAAATACLPSGSLLVTTSSSNGESTACTSTVAQSAAASAP